MVNKILIFIPVLLFSVNTFAQSVTARASTDKKNYQVGDYINYSIQVDFPKNVTVYPPFIKDSLKNIVIINKEEPVQQEKEGNTSVIYKFILGGYDSSSVTIPSISINYKSQGDTTLKSALTNPVTFLVSTLKVDQSGEIKDVKDPMKIPLDWKLILLFVLIIIIVLALAYYFYRRYKLKKLGMKQAVKVIKLPPHAAALNSLRELENKKLWQKGMIKEYHTEITEIIRKYFEERFNLPALELTTSEATEMLRQRPEAKHIQDITYNFLTNADLVKFAKFNPAGSINEEMLKQAYEIVDKTVPSASGAVVEEVKDVQ